MSEVTFKTHPIETAPDGKWLQVFVSHPNIISGWVLAFHQPLEDIKWRDSEGGDWPSEWIKCWAERDDMVPLVPYKHVNDVPFVAEDEEKWLMEMIGDAKPEETKDSE